MVAINLEAQVISRCLPSFCLLIIDIGWRLRRRGMNEVDCRDGSHVIERRMISNDHQHVEDSFIFMTVSMK